MAEAKYANLHIDMFEGITTNLDPFEKCIKTAYMWLTNYKYCHNPNDNTTQPQHCSWVGHKNDCANPTTQIQQQP